nr:ubiquitin carboxyl-terminal hydrolase MINDY-3 isoform X3 [Labrus bergylta]
MAELNKEVVDLVWGRPSSGGVSASIFRRWTQGFVFSENEHTALEQFEGGPCAVIAPVQAFFLKNILFNRESPNWRQMSEEEQKTALCTTLSEILESACSSPTTEFCLVTWAKGQSPHTSTQTNTQTQSQTQDMPESSQPSQEQQQPTALAAKDLGFEQFHSVLHKRTVVSVSGLREEVLSLYHTWRGCCGVLLFLYSVILTKGIENIRNEIQDTMEPLIDPVHGHGSQSLVNLLVTGHAVSNVWDGDRECSGMKLHGIHKQASVGFLTLMESLLYCKVQSQSQCQMKFRETRRHHFPYPNLRLHQTLPHQGSGASVAAILLLPDILFYSVLNQILIYSSQPFQCRLIQIYVPYSFYMVLGGYAFFPPWLERYKQ